MTTIQPKTNMEDWLPTRHSLIDRLKNWDDQESWKEFFDTYWKLIYQVAVKAGLTESEASDVVQETVVTVAKNMHQFKSGSEHGSFKAWLLNTTRWRIMDQFRKRASEQQFSIHRPNDDGTARTGTIERIADPNADQLASVWDHEWEKNLMDTALERLKTQVKLKHFQIFFLHVIRRVPAGQAAKSLGVSVGLVYVVKFRLARLLKKIGDHLRDTTFPE